MDIKDFINNLFFYVAYPLEICEVYSWATKKVIRNIITSESIKKIDELDIEEKIHVLCEQREISLKKHRKR